jgi:hypothetical protein
MTICNKELVWSHIIGYSVEITSSADTKNGIYFLSFNFVVQVKEDERGRACSTNGREEECI